MKRIITSIVLLTALISCKQEKETPKVIYEDGSTTDWLHLSQHADGSGYNQERVFGMGNKSNKNIKKIKKLKKLKTLRKKYTH